jgi:nucleoside-diphosphate-sugar epimerase
MATILVCGGDRGFVGRHISVRLQQAGHRVVYTYSPKKNPDTILTLKDPDQPVNGLYPSRALAVDFARDTDKTIWLDRLKPLNIDAVVNAVGVIRDTKQRPIWNVQHHTPVALFEACLELGVKTIVQISALGIEQFDNDYANSKKATENWLLQHAADRAVILRPSLIFGRGGSSSAMFFGLARVPFMLLPACFLKTKIQPVHVQDLSRLILSVFETHVSAPEINSKLIGVFDVVGSSALTYAKLIEQVAMQQGFRSPIIKALPNFVGRIAAKLGDFMPFSPLYSDSFDMLQKDSVSDDVRIWQQLEISATPIQYLVNQPTLMSEYV